MSNFKNNMKVPYGLAVHGKDEEEAVLEVIRTHKTIMGNKIKQFERTVAKLFDKKFGIMVNSGSSANLLAFELLNLPKNSEIITPILTFSTTISPIIQKQLVPVFVDVEPDTFVINVNQIDEVITKQTKAMMIPSLIGNIPNLKKIRKIADDNLLVYVEDSADTLGATFDGYSTGRYSDISTSSFYGSHIITAAGEGGIICVNKEAWNRKARILRGWGRSSAIDESEDIKKRFKVRLNNIAYDSKFIFEAIGYNFLPSEISAAFGLVQLKKLKNFAEIRQRNFKQLFNFFSTHDYFSLPKQLPQVKTSWLAFPLTIKSNAPFSRLEIVSFLEKNNIQTRPVFTGNILRQPGFKHIKHNNLRKDFPVADFVMKNSFLIGCNHGLKQKHLDKIKQTFRKFLDKF